MHVYMCGCTCVHAYICACTYMYVYVHVCMCIPVYISVYEYMCVSSVYNVNHSILLKPYIKG